MNRGDSTAPCLHDTSNTFSRPDCEARHINELLCLRRFAAKPCARNSADQSAQRTTHNTRAFARRAQRHLPTHATRSLSVSNPRRSPGVAPCRAAALNAFKCVRFDSPDPPLLTVRHASHAGCHTRRNASESRVSRSEPRCPGIADNLQRAVRMPHLLPQPHLQVARAERSSLLAGALSNTTIPNRWRSVGDVAERIGSSARIKCPCGLHAQAYRHCARG